MGFSSLIYVFFFLPAVLLAYYLIPGRYSKGIVLLAASLVFYAWGRPIYLVLLILACVFNYLCGLDLAERLKRPDAGRGKLKLLSFLLAIAVNLLLPFFAVYLPVMMGGKGFSGAEEIALPLGLMFLTLRALSYQIDIWRGRIRAEKNFLAFAVYYTFFPIVALGPAERYENLLPTINVIFRRGKPEELKRSRLGPSFALAGSGVERFLFGFLKKTLFATPLYALSVELRAIPESEGTIALAWILVLAYALWLYMELSSYADMAIGTGLMLGFCLTEDFDHPFLALSIRDFWQRWHITVSSWFRDYIYQPIREKGGKLIFEFIGLVLAAGLFALWHGTSRGYFVFAAYMVILLIIEKSPIGRLLTRFPESVRWFCTGILLLAGVGILLGDPTANVFSVTAALFGAVPGGLANETMLYHLRTHWLLILLSAVTASGLFLVFFHWLRERVPLAAVILLLALFGLALAFALGAGPMDSFARLALGI